MINYKLKGKDRTSTKRPNHHQIAVLGKWIRRAFGVAAEDFAAGDQVDADELALVGAAAVGLVWDDGPLTGPGFYSCPNARAYGAAVLTELLERNVADYPDFIHAAGAIVFELEQTHLITQTEVDAAASPS